MGSLKKLKLPREIVDTAGGPLELRGLSFTDITVLVGHHKPVVSTMFEKIIKGGETRLDLESLSGLGTDLLKHSPEVAAELIALANGDGDAESIEIAANLPFPVALEALEKIAKLTFASEGGLGKMIETVIRVATGTQSAVAKLQEPLPSGPSPSEAT